MVGKWAKKGCLKVAEHIEEYVEECLTCLAFPESHQRRIRTTNGFERLNQEIKRRTRAVRIFPNREACLQLMSALCQEHSDSGLRGGRQSSARSTGHQGSDAQRVAP